MVFIWMSFFTKFSLGKYSALPNSGMGLPSGPLQSLLLAWCWVLMLGPVLQLESRPLLDHLQVGQLRVEWALSAVIGSAGNGLPWSFYRQWPACTREREQQQVSNLPQAYGQPSMEKGEFLHALCGRCVTAGGVAHEAQSLEHLSWVQSSPLPPHPLT